MCINRVDLCHLIRDEHILIQLKDIMQSKVHRVYIKYILYVNNIHNLITLATLKYIDLPVKHAKKIS